MEELKALLVTILGEVIAYLIIRGIEEREARRRSRPKHMRQGK